MNYIEYKEGKVYDPAHLRPFDLGLAKQGHPCATKDGDEIRLLRVMRTRESCGFLFNFDSWVQEAGAWINLTNNTYLDELPRTLRLAPLAVKDGKPLHVGGVIDIPSIEIECGERVKSFSKYEVRSLKNFSDLVILGDSWRWPAEVKE